MDHPRRFPRVTSASSAARAAFIPLMGVVLAVGTVAFLPAAAHAAVTGVRTLLPVVNGAPVVPVSLALTADRVVGLDENVVGVDAVTWSRTVSAGGYGARTVFPGHSSDVAASAGRTVLLGLDGVGSSYDRGVLQTTFDLRYNPEISGPYMAGIASGYGAILTADGASTGGGYASVEAMFGPRFVEMAYTGPGGTGQAEVRIIDASGNALYPPLVGLTGSVECYDVMAWGEFLVPRCWDNSLRAYNLLTGQSLGLKDAAGGNGFSTLAVGDGYVIYQDLTTYTYNVWRADGSVTELTDCTGAKPATDGVGHVVCASDTELIWRDFSASSTSPGRVLGWLAPSYFASGSWTPQIDVTKAFSAGVLRIRHGSTVIREIAVPASADGSVRGVSWDGKDTGGTVMPTGAYIAELVVVGKDGTGAVKALDGVSAPTFDVAWTGPGAPADLPGSFVPLAPSRILDTRIAAGGSGPVAANGTIDVQVTGRGGVPSSGVGAVVLNVTAVTPKAAGFLTVYPTGSSTPNASNLNFIPGQVVPNLALAKLGPAGTATVRNSSMGTTEVVVDVAGYFVGGTVVDSGGVVAVSPARLLDTRKAYGGAGAPVSGNAIKVQATGRGGVPASGVSAVVVNLTTINPSPWPGYLTAYPTGRDVPNVSNVNFAGNDVVPNLAFVKLGPDGAFNINVMSGQTDDVVVDVVGYVIGGLVTGSKMFVPLVPARVLDTRPTSFGGTGGVPANSVRVLSLAGMGGLPAAGGLSGAVINVTAVAGPWAGYLTVYPADLASAPTASNVNFTPNQVVPNLVAVKTSSAGAVAIRNGSPGATNVVVDVAGYFTA